MSPEELNRVGSRLRELRLAAGLTQAQLAGRRYSHAYVSVLEAGRREPSRTALDYFAGRLGVAVEEIWGERGASWALEMAADLRSKGQDAQSRELLMRTLSNLERDRELHPRVLVVLHKELARIALRTDQDIARSHLLKALDLSEGDDALASERGLTLVMLGDLAAADGDDDVAIQYFRSAINDFVDVLGRRADLDSAGGVGT